MSFTMQRYLEGWIGPSTQQQMLQRQAPSVRGGYVNVHGQIGDAVQAYAQGQAQQMAWEPTTRGQTGARNLPHLTNQSLAQPMPQLTSAQMSSDLKTSLVTSSIIPSPLVAVQNTVNAGSGLYLDDAVVVASTQGPPNAPQTTGSQTQPQPRQYPNLLHPDRQATAQYQAQQPLPARDTPRQARSSGSPQHLTRGQSQLVANACAQHQSQGPVIGHGPMGPVYLNGHSPRRRRSQFSDHEDTTSEAEGQEHSQSPSRTMPRSIRKRGRPTNVEREARQMQREADDRFLPR